MSAAKNEALTTVGAAQGFGGQATDLKQDSASPAAAGKDIARISAALALKGYALHRLVDGCLLIERWGYSRTVDSIVQAAQFLAQIGGRHG